jgi:hypothetical protein
MHPYIMREVARQRAAERQEEARKASVARALRKTMRQRNRAEAVGTVILPPIPDYVDGAFAEADHQVPADRTGAAR